MKYRCMAYEEERALTDQDLDGHVWELMSMEPSAVQARD